MPKSGYCRVLVVPIRESLTFRAQAKAASSPAAVKLGSRYRF